MNRQDIIAMAVEAGATTSQEHWQLYPYAIGFDMDRLEKFAALVVAHDRQRLAAGVSMPGPIACLVETEDGDMVWPITDWRIALDYCDFNEEPDKLFTADQLRDYGDRRAAAEREAIAKFCEENEVAVGGKNGRGFLPAFNETGGIHQGMDYAKAIRSKFIPMVGVVS